MTASGSEVQAAVQRLGKPWLGVSLCPEARSAVGRALRHNVYVIAPIHLPRSCFDETAHELLTFRVRANTATLAAGLA